ncbi:hypothetical protein, partial [Kitasatospora sp. NPDC088346]|uniref:hypothetical protein n=1 Tax=Kitasatospora sp. NPDC088346 TaxID=3364073 RepID=UPI0038047007
PTASPAPTQLTCTFNPAGTPEPLNYAERRQEGKQHAQVRGVEGGVQFVDEDRPRAFVAGVE